MALTLGILALVEAKPGKEAEVEAFVKGGQSIVEQEPGTRVWYGFRVDGSTFGIFDAFEDEAARQAHLSGQIPAALAAAGPQLLAEGPGHPPRGRPRGEGRLDQAGAGVGPSASVRAGRVASIDPAITRANPIAIGTVNVSCSTNTPEHRGHGRVDVGDDGGAHRPDRVDEGAEQDEGGRGADRRRGPRPRSARWPTASRSATGWRRSA